MFDVIHIFFFLDNIMLIVLAKCVFVSLSFKNKELQKKKKKKN